MAEARLNRSSSHTPMVGEVAEREHWHRYDPLRDVVIVSVCYSRLKSVALFLHRENKIA